MADTTGIRNVTISLDIENSQVKLMKILGTSIEDSVIELLPYDKKDLAEVTYGTMLVAALKPYMERSNMKFVNFHLVLPDELFAMWRIGVPTKSKIKIEDAIQTEIEKDLEDIKKFKYNTTLVSNDGNSAIFFTEAVNLEFLNEIKIKLAEIGIVPKTIMSKSVSVVNSILALRVRARENTYALVDIRKGSTTMSYVDKSRYLGNINLDFGYEILRTDRFVDEELLFNHDSATVVLAHALETTAHINEVNEEDILPKADVKDDMFADEPVSEKEEKEREEANKRFEEAAEFAKSLDSEVIKQNEQKINNESSDEMAVDKQDESDDNLSITNKLYETKDNLSITNKLYETRDDFNITNKLYNTSDSFNITNKLYDTKGTSELYQLSSTFDLHVTGRLNTTDMFTTSGITLRDNVLQNFRIFMRHINLFVEYCNSLEPNMPKLEYILVNIPKRYSFLLTKANAERGNSIEYKYFNPTVEDKPLFTENLDLYGVLMDKNYNTNHTFD